MYKHNCQMSFPNTRITKTLKIVKMLIGINNDKSGISDSFKIDNKFTKDSNSNFVNISLKLVKCFHKNFLIQTNNCIDM